MTSVRQGRQLSHTGDSGGVTLETYADGFLVSGVKLMEKPGLTLQQGTQDNSIWGEKAGNGIQHHTQYIRRLADLRDELLSQEQTALARALDRLRLDSISNRDAARYRLKMKDNSQAASGSDGDGKTIAAGAASRSMMTTVEKFRQMRPQRHAPAILPLQGKQLIETSVASTASGGKQTGNENASKMESSLRVEESVRSSLQRLIQPTSSIPNIGRKALRQESLELKTQSLHHMRSRVYRSTRNFRSPFITQGDGENVMPSTHPPSEVNVDLSPHVYKLGPMTEGDRINMEKLKQYYYICCLPSTPSSPDTDRQSEAMSTPRRGGIRKLRVGSKRNPAAKPARGLARAAAAGDSLETEVWQPRQRRSGEGASSDRVTLPDITRHRESPVTNNTHGYPNDYTGDSPGTLLEGERKRRQIVIDMPNIIFNAATPETAVESKADRAPLQNAGSLRKTLLQNEIRHREVHNLLEDVKDLNKRTETLTSQCTSETC
ncbi:uncharacterized protein LOC112564579 isoform X3 [Pomacea canaliculata]|uniref:uncharacterized protein LOC112564579 isoform X3 n=1 Tax=Pomacea canaliculata TaxID=400727 RepID=UPI000D72A9F8|nr:uncharacterized protein LOC112564579 isoform X3 [Pomacea canaliculata]